MKISFSINQHDSEGDCFEQGIYLHFNDMFQLRVNNLYELCRIQKQLKEITREIMDNYPEVK